MNSRDRRLYSAIAREHFWFFLEYVHRGAYRHGPHTLMIANLLQNLPPSSRLLILAPPRHSKSWTVTESFPAYYLGRFPDRRVITVSYSDLLAQRFGRSNRQKLWEYGPEIFNIRMSQSHASSTNWQIEGRTGGMVSAGIGGSITGEGADLMIIDDPVKNRSEALSATYRESVWREWESTLQTRLTPTGSVIVIMTRWHADDLGGRLEREGGWQILKFPCEAEADDLLGRQPGEPLWPARGFTAEWVQNQKRSVGSIVWASLYQQRPSPEGGEIIKRSWWRMYREPPAAFDRQIQSWDMSFKETDTGSYVVGQVWGVRSGEFFLLDQIRARMDFPTVIQAIKTLSAKWPKAIGKFVEDKANGPAVISSLRQEIPGLIPVEPRGSKVARAYAVSPVVESGNVFLPEADWVHDFIEECTAFPTGSHDDQVDAMSQALGELIEIAAVSDEIRFLFQKGSLYDA